MRGGKRPGAGAPKGNTNALKTGHYSPRAQALARALRRLHPILARLTSTKPPQGADPPPARDTHPSAS